MDTAAAETLTLGGNREIECSGNQYRIRNDAVACVPPDPNPGPESMILKGGGPRECAEWTHYTVKT